MSSLEDRRHTRIGAGLAAVLVLAAGLVLAGQAAAALGLVAGAIITSLMARAIGELGAGEVRYALGTEALRRETVRRLTLEALEAADGALMDARNGLDLGLGCARALEGDRGPRATAPRSARQEDYLERARAAHREVRAAAERIADVAAFERELAGEVKP